MKRTNAEPLQVNDWSDAKQTMDGFGVYAACYAANNIRLIPADLRAEGGLTAVRLPQAGISNLVG